MDEFHRVTKDELLKVHHWLEAYLPDCWQLYGIIREVLCGRWKGQTFYTLGWPVIRGVVNGELESDHLAVEFMENVRRKLVFAPEPNDVETIFRCSKFVDWTKDFIALFLNDQMTSIVQKLAKEQGYNECSCYPLHLLKAEPGDIEPRPIPEGFKLRKLNPETDLKYFMATWQENRPGTPEYMKALIRHMPNACLADSASDKCVSFEIGTEMGLLRWLHTKEGHREKGLAKALVSRLAQEYFEDGFPCLANVYVDNPMALRFHTSLGFKQAVNFNVVYFKSVKK